MPRRVLFMECSNGFGGSITGLARLISHMDPKRYVARAVVSHPLHRDYLLEHAPVESVVVDTVRVHTPETRLGRLLTATIGRCGRPGGSLASAAIFAANIVGPVPRFVRRVQRSFANVRFDAVWTNNNVKNNCGAAGWLARRWGVPWVCKVQGFDYVCPTTRWLTQFVDLYLPDSEAVAAPLLAMGVPRERIQVTYCPVDTVMFDPDRVKPTGEFKSFGGRANTLAFGVIGQLLEWKGQHVFLQAARKVLEECRGSVAVVIGGEPDRSGGRLEHLRQYAAQLGISDRVIFTGHRDDIPQAMAELDVVVHASIKPEPFGTVVAEAMAMKRAVIAMRAGGPAEVVQDGVNGLLCDPASPDQMAAAILRLLTDSDLRCRLGEQGRKTVLARFSAEQHARATQSLLDSLIESRAGHRSLDAGRVAVE